MSKEKLLSRNQFLATFGYVGTSFFGVQEQPGLPTVLGAMRERIEKYSGQKACALVAAARTDRGVHAKKNFVTFYLREPLDIKEFIHSMEKKLDDDLFNVSVLEVSPYVHARGNSQGKTYKYLVKDNCTDYDLATLDEFSWQIAPMLKIERLQLAASHLIGTKDFSSFRGGGCQAASPIKTIYSIDIIRDLNGIISIEIKGNAFLRRMIRNMVGLLVEIGSGLKEPSDVVSILEQKTRDIDYIMAPPQGLCLVEVGIKI